MSDLVLLELLTEGSNQSIRHKSLRTPHLSAPKNNEGKNAKFSQKTFDSGLFFTSISIFKFEGFLIYFT